MTKFIEPLKHLEVSPFIHDIRNVIHALQQKEYGKDTLEYLVGKRLTGKPYEINAGEPDQIIQIKQLSNALYLAEQVFAQLEKLNFTESSSIIGLWNIRDQADDASHLLLNIGGQVAGTFKHEISMVLSCLSQVKSFTGCGLLKSRIDPKTLTAQKISTLLENRVGCVQYGDIIYYFNNNALDKISASKTLALKKFFHGMQDDECRMATGSEIEAITEAIGQNPIMSHFFESSAFSANITEIISRNAGLASGLVIDQMKPAAGKLDYDLLTYFSGVLPTYIETVRVGIETSSANASLSVPNVDQEKMADVLHKKLDRLSSSIKAIIDAVKNIKDPMSLMANLPALFHLPYHFRQMQPLLTEIFHEVDHLDDTVQGLVHENLAKLKYEALPNLFAFVDKFELHLLLKPGRLSKPLMDQVKPLHEILVQTAKTYLNAKFTNNAERLLKLEDAHFIALRLAPLNQQRDVLNQELHQIKLSLLALNTHLDEVKADENSPAVNSKASLRAHFTLLKPYLTQLDSQCKKILDEHMLAEQDLHPHKNWWASVFAKSDKSSVLPSLNTLKLHLEQMRDDRIFRLKCCNELVESVHAKAHMVVFEHTPRNTGLSEEEAFAHRHSLSDTIQFDDNGTITNPQELKDDEVWDLYQWYENKLTNLKRADGDCDNLLKALRLKTGTIAFNPDYIPCLQDDTNIQHQPNHFYVNIENGSLKYEVIEPLPTPPCSLLKLSDIDPQTLDRIQISSLLGNHDGFIQFKNNVFYFDTIKLNFVPPENIPRLLPVMNALENNKLRIIDAMEPDFNIITSEGIRAACKLYLMHLDDAKKAGHRDCYVWNDEINQLSYIDANGNSQNKITLSAIHKTMLIGFISAKKIPIIKRFERARLNKHRVADIDTGECNYRNLTDENIATFITPAVNGLSWSSVEPVKKNLKNSTHSHYIRTTCRFGYELFYYNKESDTLTKIVLDNTQSENFNKNFKANVGIKHLSPAQLNCITSITGHVSSNAGHHRGLIRSGTIPLSELNCPLTSLSSITELKPFLAGVFDKALERGHIIHDEKSQCIRWYSSIQPYLVEAFKLDERKGVKSFDKDAVRFLSGLVYRNPPEPRPFFSFADFKPLLLGLKNELQANQRMLETKRNRYFNLIKNQPFSTESRPVDTIYHHQFSRDVADFMLSIEPIRRQVHESGKTIFRAKLALEHLEQYVRNNGADTLDQHNTHYPWFHAFVMQLKDSMQEKNQSKPITKTQLKTHLKQILFFEETDIQRNKSIMESFNKRVPHTTEPCDLTEATAFRHLAHDFKSCLIQENNELEPGQLHIKISGKILHYQFLHYGKLQTGNINLSKLGLSPSHFDEKTPLGKKTISQILSLAYEQRSREIDSDKTLISPDEALDLYQWYSSKQKEMDGYTSAEKASLQKKLALYEIKASKQPTFKIEPEKIVKISPEVDRSRFLIKHTKCSVALAELKKAIQNHYDSLNASFKLELKPSLLSGIPFPYVNTEYPLTKTSTQHIVADWALTASPLLKWRAEDILIGSLRTTISSYVNVDFVVKSALQTLITSIEGIVNAVTYARSFLPEVKVYSPQQVLAYKRLINMAYYLEQMMIEIEKVNEDESKLTRVNHLLISYLYYAQISPLAIALSDDPHFGPFIRDIVSKIESEIKNVTDESEHYSVIPQMKTGINPVSNLHSLYLMNVLKMLPERISLTSEAYKKKLPTLKASAEVATANIEKIINDYHASFSYLRLFLDLPMIFQLLNELPKSITNFTDKANLRIKDDLNTAPPEFLSQILMEADSWENTIGLKPGTLSVPLKKILDEFYKGLITPLILDADKQVNLLCDTTCMEKRIGATRRRRAMAKVESVKHDYARKKLQDALKKCETGGEPNFPELDATYKTVLPLIKKALNGSELYIMSFKEAKNAGHKDCFIWDDKTSQLFHIDARGLPNPQTGCDLYLKSIPVDETITDHIADHNVKMSMPGKNKTWLAMNVKKPTLIKQGDKYFIYLNATGDGWKLTELDPGVISKMNLDFDNTKFLQRNQKYGDMYAEITSKTNWIYPIHLKSTHHLLEFITKKAATLKNLYLSENEIKKFISSNSNFIQQKHGVSLPNDLGCCLISMPTIPTNFESLKLPLDYNACYVQVSGIRNALFFIEQKTKSIIKLDITPDQQIRFENKMSKIRKNKLLIDVDFNTIKSLTGHVYEPEFISNLDRFVANKHTLEQLKLLITQCNDYYEVLHATSELAAKAALEQLHSLTARKDLQQTSNETTKHLVFTDYFNKKVVELCNDAGKLQGYTLRLLTDSVKIKKNHLYVNIRGKMLDYQVIDPQGVTQKGSIELDSINCNLKQLASANELLAWLPAILKKTSKQGYRNTLSHSLATEYQEKLKEALSTERTAIINAAMTSNSKSIEEALNDAKTKFNQDHLKQYQKLNAVNQALDEFMLYLHQAKKLWVSKHSLFESDETIRGKRSTLDLLDTLASNENKDVSVRIEEIKAYLIEDETLEHLLNYANYESNSFARLFQLVMRFFEVLGLYTPTVVQHVDKLLSAIDEPVENLPKQPTFLFFTQTTRARIQTRAEELKVKSKEEPKLTDTMLKAPGM